MLLLIFLENFASASCWDTEQTIIVHLTAWARPLNPVDVKYMCRSSKTMYSFPVFIPPAHLPLSILLVFLPPIPSGSMVAINEPQLPALALRAMNKALCWEPSTSDELNRGAIVGLYYSPNMACAFAVAEVHHCPSSECIDPHYKCSTERSLGWCTHEIQSKSSSSSVKP